MHFSGQGHQLLRVKLDHTLYLINYGICTAKQGDKEKTKYLWKRRRIWDMMAVIWLVIGGVPLAIIISVALLYCVKFKYSN